MFNKLFKRPYTIVKSDPDAKFCANYDWDLTGMEPQVAQPNLPGSLLIPRVGWEVMVAFEDGDPDRPVIVGRVYNAKVPPPFALPAKPSMTAPRMPARR